MIIKQSSIHLLKYTDVTKIRLKPCNIHFWSEESYFVIKATIGLHSFKQLNGIVKSLGRRMQDQVVHWTYPRLTPATVSPVLHLTIKQQDSNEVHVKPYR